MYNSCKKVVKLYNTKTKKEEVAEYSFEELIPLFDKKMKYLAYKWTVNVYYDMKEEYYQELNIALWKAFNYYKLPYSFNYTVNMYFKSTCFAMYKKYKKLYPNNIVSISEPVGFNKDGDEMFLEDILGEEDQYILTYAEVEASKNLLSMLSERQRDEIMSLVVDEETKKAMAAKYKMDYYSFKKRAIATMNRFRTIFITEENKDSKIRRIS